MSIAEIPKSSSAVPPLQPGDRLNRVEFERRYISMANCKKAELIEGVVYMPSPARLRHSQPHGRLITWHVIGSSGPVRLNHAKGSRSGTDLPT